MMTVKELKDIINAIPNDKADVILVVNGKAGFAEQVKIYDMDKSFASINITDKFGD